MVLFKYVQIIHLPSFCQSGVGCLTVVLMMNGSDERGRVYLGTFFPLAVKYSGDRPLPWILAICNVSCLLQLSSSVIIEKRLDPYGFNGMVIFNPSGSPHFIWYNCSQERKSAIDLGAGYLAP